jgi:sugar (pentulose or hexulose) kinase
MENYHIAVLDIGKTNKKILIYDAQLQIVHEEFERIPEIEEGDCLLDDVESLKAWITDIFSKLSGRFNIKVIATSAHGATYSVVDDQANHVIPQVAYNTDPGDDFHQEFYKKCGDPVELQKSLATPNFNLLINPAKGIFFSQKKYADDFARARHILLYAQYFGFWLTGKLCADPTYVGNHTYLWNFEKKDWSKVADKLGIKHLLPQTFKSPWESLGPIKKEFSEKTGLSPDTIVTAGIHDSNASMLPYIISMDEPFLLNSTGTWCVIMNEKEQVKFEKDELGKVVFYNINAFWKPVKTAIFLGGMEFEHYAKMLMKIHGRSDFPSFNEKVYQQVIDDNSKFILPSVAKGIGQFPESKPRVIEKGRVYSLADIESGTAIPEFFKNYEEALAVLNLSLAIQTKVSFDRADMTKGLQVFTEGGFSKNDSYNTLMTSFYPDSKFYLTGLKEASAFGAAITGKAAYEKLSMHSLATYISIDKQLVPGNDLTGTQQYYEKFLSLI